MGFLNWVVAILAICAPRLVAKEKANEVSIAVLVALVAFHRRDILLGWNPGRGESSNSPKTSLSSRFKMDAREVNDSLYELYKPEGVPTMQVLFFHGLPFGDSSEAHLSTWESGDGTCIWPKVWLAKKFPNAHILVVSYAECAKKGSSESFDMRIISENLTTDLMEANIGQAPLCPVILVGHSFGGLVIKELCMEAQKRLIVPSDNSKVKRFLDNLSGVFYYSTPHHGSPHIERAKSVLSRPLFEYFTTLSKEASRLNYDFNRLCNSYRKWRIEGLGEQLPVKMGIFQGIVVVPEASARDGEVFTVEYADHFSICKPQNTKSRRFNALTRLLHNVWHDLKVERERQDQVIEQDKVMAQKEVVYQNMQPVPKQVINIDVLLKEVKPRLEKFSMLGFVGMGGLGKTTLAKAVFNNVSPTLEYSCFVPDVKSITGTVEEAKQVVWKHMHHLGRKVGDKGDFSDLNGKGLLLVLDDISTHRDITLLSHLVNGPSPQSRFIVTSRLKNLLRSLDDIDIYEVPLLDPSKAEELFMTRAFPTQAILPPKLVLDIRAIVEKCGGLPLTLEVLGNYLRNKEDGRFWKQTLLALEKAQAIDDLEERLWTTLKVSYDGLKDVEKQMFLDATTFFSERRKSSHSLSLREAKATWREAYATEYESLHWQTLVDRSLVYHVEEGETIKVHDQLLSLGRKIASDCCNHRKCRIWEKTMALKLLQNKELDNQDVHALRLSYEWVDGRFQEIHMSSHSLQKMKKLQYLDVDGPLIIDGDEEESSFPSKLLLLNCVRPIDTFDLGLQTHLVVLHLSEVEVLPRCIEKLSALKVFTAAGLGSLPDEFGNLSQLEYLEFRACAIQSLPDTFGNLLNLENLNFFICGHLQFLPETFGNLSKLEYLTFKYCAHLKILPDTFGGLFNLKDLEFSCCYDLDSLPETFGCLSALNHLVLSFCSRLCSLPKSFGNLSALKHLEINRCRQLCVLPNSFGNLSALEHLKLNECQLQALPRSFGKLSTLRHLQLTDNGNLLSAITFSQFTQLEFLAISAYDGPVQIEELPESLGELMALRHLVLDSVSVRSIPDFIKNMKSLHTLELSLLPYIRELPAWLGDTGGAPLALSRKIFHVEDGRFTLTSEDSHSMARSRWLIQEIHRNAMEKVRESNCDGALADLCLADLQMLVPELQRFVLQERGIVRRIMGDLQGALGDLTAALEVFSEADDERRYLYDCWKHRGYVNFLSGDLDGARKDIDLMREYEYDNVFRSPSLGEQSVMYLNFRLVNRREADEIWQQMDVSHFEVMDKVRVSDFQGALAAWDVESMHRADLRVFFLQERGILKRMTGDLHGALKDLSASLKAYGKLVDLRHPQSGDIKYCKYNGLKHRGFVKLLLGDMDGAQKDGAMAMKLISCADCSPGKRLISPNLGEELLSYMDFKLHPTNGHDKQKKLRDIFHNDVMEKVRDSNFSEALMTWENFDGTVSGYADRVFFLQERGVLKRLAGDLQGAWDDLTSALEILSEGNENCCEFSCWQRYRYNCLKHLGYVNFLMGDIGRAQDDGANALKLALNHDNRIYIIPCLRGSLGEESVTYLHFRLISL
ncbi:unnamed protein product [Calypogeia fissa]